LRHDARFYVRNLNDQRKLVDELAPAAERASWGYARDTEPG
jgi:hypothetical protein